MKKILLLLLVLVLNCCILASPVSAKGDNAKGAVKVDLVEAIMISESPPIYLPVLDNVVGSVILRTTGNGKLIVIVNMDNAPNLSDYDVVVFWWNSLSYALDTSGGGMLNTNEKGHGNATVKIDLNTLIPDGGDSINVMVYVGDLGIVEWETPFPPYTEVPLK